MKQTYIKGKMEVPPWIGQLQKPLEDLKQVLQALNLNPSVPYKVKRVNKNTSRTIQLQHQQRQNSM